MELCLLVHQGLYYIRKLFFFPDCTVFKYVTINQTLAWLTESFLPHLDCFPDGCDTYRDPHNLRSGFVCLLPTHSDHMLTDRLAPSHGFHLDYRLAGQP